MVPNERCSDRSIRGLWSAAIWLLTATDHKFCNLPFNNKNSIQLSHTAGKSIPRYVFAFVCPSVRLSTFNLRIIQKWVKYLGHIINNDERDDKDVLRDVRAMFTRTNILVRRFSLCSVSVKIALFRLFCICFYGMELWSCYTACAINSLRSCCIKCTKTFFKYLKYYSVTSMLLELGLPSFDTLIINSRINLTRQLHCSNNSVIRQLSNFRPTCNLDFIDFMYFCISNVYICQLSIFYVLWAKCLK